MDGNELIPWPSPPWGFPYRRGGNGSHLLLSKDRIPSITFLYRRIMPKLRVHLPLLNDHTLSSFFSWLMLIMHDMSLNCFFLLSIRVSHNDQCKNYSKFQTLMKIRQHNSYTGISLKFAKQTQYSII